MDAAGGAAFAGRDAGGGWVFRIAPMMKNSVPMPNAEIIRDSLRPSVSTKKKTNIAVATTFTIP